jgi:hypothetical protein
LEKDGTEVRFDKKSSGGDGPTMAVLIEPTNEEPEVAMLYQETDSTPEDVPEETPGAREVAMLARVRPEKVDINKFHKLLGHVGDQKLKTTARDFGIELKGEIAPCVSCKLAKAKKKAINKVAVNKSQVPMERLFVDIYSFNTSSLGGKYHWLLIVDEYTGMKWSMFLQFKSDLADAMLAFLDERWDEGMHVQCIRMDNAGENTKLAERMRSNERYMGITVEYTSPHTPQQNGVVERAFPSILGRVRAMMLGAKFDRNMKERMWAEAINTATLLDNATSKDDSGCARVNCTKKIIPGCQTCENLGNWQY